MPTWAHENLLYTHDLLQKLPQSFKIEFFLRRWHKVTGATVHSATFRSPSIVKQTAEVIFSMFSLEPA